MYSQLAILVQPSNSWHCVQPLLCQCSEFSQCFRGWLLQNVVLNTYKYCVIYSIPLQIVGILSMSHIHEICSSFTAATVLWLGISARVDMKIFCYQAYHLQFEDLQNGSCKLQTCLIISGMGGSWGPLIEGMVELTILYQKYVQLFKIVFKLR